MDEGIADRILSQFPWAVMKQNILVKRWPEELALEDIHMELVPFWIQIKRIPLRLTSEANLHRLVIKVGEFIKFEDPSKAQGFLRVRVVINTLNPLINWCWLSRG